MRDTAPAGFVDFVVARGPALHRTAVLLTRQEQSAEDLVQITLAKAWRSWGRIDANHEAYVPADHRQRVRLFVAEAVARRGVYR